MKPIIRPPRNEAEVIRWREDVTRALPNRVMFTPEGGLAVKFINKSGVDTVKGTLVQVDTTTDESMTTATSPYTVQGPWYDDGVADGDYAYVVIAGIAEVLLEDNTSATRGHWCRLSSTTAGRMDATQDLPGLEEAGDTLAYTTGSTASGSLANTAVDDGSYLEIQPATGSPGLDLSIEFDCSELLPLVFFKGYYTGANSLQIFPYDYVAAGWDSAIITIPTGGSADIELDYTGLQSKHFDATNGKMKLRFYMSSAGNTSKRLWIDKLVMSSPSSNEHFKEIGHCLENVTGGTDKLAKINIHLL